MCLKICIFSGATRVGGLELVDDIAKGKVDVAEIDHFIAHEDMMTELKPLIGEYQEFCGQYLMFHVQGCYERKCRKRLQELWAPIWTRW